MLMVMIPDKAGIGMVTVSMENVVVVVLALVITEKEKIFP